MSIDIIIKDAANEPRDNIHRIVSALLVLAGDVPVDVDIQSHHHVDAAPELGAEYGVTVPDPTPSDPHIGMTFNAEELAEAEHLGKSAPASASTIPPASQVFAQSSAVAVPSPIVPVAPPAPTSAVPVNTPPAPLAAVPPAPAAPALTNPAPNGEVDAKGVQWDERIHSSSKAKISDGTWKLKRGVDKAFVSAVLAEQGVSAPTAPPVPQPIAAQVPPAPTPSPASADAGTPAITSIPVPAAPPAPSADQGVALQPSGTPPDGAPIPAKPRTWMETVTRVVTGQAEKKWLQGEVFAALGIEGMGAINGKQAEIDRLNAYLDQIESAAL